MGKCDGMFVEVKQENKINTNGEINVNQ